MPKYVITGGAGFIGSHLAEALVKEGQQVVVLDNLSTGKEENLSPVAQGTGSLEFIEGDIRDIETCRKAMQGAEFVLHQAARASVQRSIENPALTTEVNVNGGLNVMIAAQEAGVKRLVSASSSSVYGDREDPLAPKREDMDPRPMSPYAASKLAVEHYLQAFHRAYGLETVSLRYFNVFGARQDPDSAYAAVIPKFLFSLMNGGRPVIFGDGGQSRDFTYIDNVVRANLAACRVKEAAGKIFNVASGASHSLLDLLKLLGGLLGVEPKADFAPPRQGDVRASLADLSRIKKVLGYEVSVDFAQGLGKLVELAKQGKYLAK